MNKLHIKVKSFEHKTIEEIEKSLREKFQDIEFIKVQEDIFNYVLKEKDFFIYYVYIERKVD